MVPAGSAVWLTSNGAKTAQELLLAGTDWVRSAISARSHIHQDGRGGVQNPEGGQ